MNISKTTLFIAFLVILFASLYLQKRIYSSKLSNLVPVSILEDAESVFQKKQENDAFREFLQFSNSSLEMNTTIMVKQESSVIPFSDLLESEYKLFFNFSDINCTTCINQEVENIKAFSDSLGTEKIVLLANYRNERALIIFKRMNNLQNEIYNLNFEQLGLPIENYNLPYYFIANNSGITEHVFIPEKERSDLSAKYYEAMIPLLR